MQVGHAYHTGFTVNDIERSVVFYRDVLGLKLVKRQTGTAPYLATVTGFEGCASRPRCSSRRLAAACWSCSSTSRTLRRRQIAPRTVPGTPTSASRSTTCGRRARSSARRA